MSEHEIQFGDLEETQRLQRLRPDHNRQLAVVACGQPDPGDLPIFVDFDVLREMESHAESDIRVELGGVLLGGQFEDDGGQPYVVVQDSLRARHYESSKGSFKFTHDTWSDITRRREEFPSELQMVGWYHTHPDWGVFLSGMDLFICDNFFNRPLDVALVIDPCRGDRGWFQWTADPGQRTRRTAGFYLFASRHRTAELEAYAAHLEGRLAMAHDPRSAGSGYPPAFYPLPVSTPPDPRTLWLAVGLLGMLGMQFALLVLIAWRLLSGEPLGALADGAASRPALVAGAPEVQGGAEHRLLAERLQAQRELLDRVLSTLSSTGPQGVVSQLEQQRSESERLQTEMRVYRDLEAKTHAENQSLSDVLKEAEEQNASLRRKVNELDLALVESRSQARTLKKQLERLEEEYQVAGSADGDDSQQPGLLPSWQNWWLWIGGGVLLLAVVGLGYAVLANQSGRDRFEAGDDVTGPPPRSEGRERESRDPERQ